MELSVILRCSDMHKKSLLLLTKDVSQLHLDLNALLDQLLTF